MNRIKEVRLARGRSQQDLAEVAGVTRQAIGKIENGLSTPGGDVLVRIAHYLGVSSAYLLGKTDSPERDDRLPADWVQTVEEAMSKGFSPEDVRRAIRMLEVALGRAEGTPHD